MNKRKDAPKEIIEEAKFIADELTKLSKDPEVLKRCREFHRKVTRMKPEDLLKEFTI